METLAAFNNIPEVIFLLVVNFFVLRSLQLNWAPLSAARYLLLLGLIKEEALPCFAAWMWSNSEEADSCLSVIRPSPSPMGNGQAKREGMGINSVN